MCACMDKGIVGGEGGINQETKKKIVISRTHTHARTPPTHASDRRLRAALSL